MMMDVGMEQGNTSAQLVSPQVNKGIVVQSINNRIWVKRRVRFRIIWRDKK